MADPSRSSKNRKTGRSRRRADKQRPAHPQDQSLRSALFRPDLVSLLAHQLVTPVSTIITLAQSLGRRADTMQKGEIRDRAERIRQSGLRLIALIESIMERARADAGVIRLHPRSFDPRTVAQRVCQEQRDLHPDRSFLFEIGTLPEAMHGDPALLEQVVAILLSNAIKYSPPDRPVTVQASRRDDAVGITIRDQGIGIPAEDRPHLTEPFYRGQNARSTPGTGLGLSLARHILDLHGGRLDIESEEGRGTSVTMLVPMSLDWSPGDGI